MNDPVRRDADPSYDGTRGYALLSIVVAAALVGCPKGQRSAPSETPAKKRRVVDVHTHVSPTELDRLHSILDETGVDWVVNLSGMWPGGPLETQLEAADRSGRIVVAMTLPWGLAARHEKFPEVAAKMMHEGKRLGVRGLKIGKALGLLVPKPDGTLLAVDDPWLDPIWKAAADTGLPVVIHTADPKAFWLPSDEKNERLEELTAHPTWSYYGKPVPSFDELLEQLMNVVKRHPKTTFVAVHFGNNSEDPFWVSKMLDEHPNLHVDIAARVVELGRHDPKKLRAVFVKHRKRILFGTDLGVSPKNHLMLGSFGEEPNKREEVGPFFAAHYDWLETSKTMPSPTPIQGRWKIHGIDLPDDVLEDVYYKNAERMFGPPPKKKAAPAPAPQ